MSKYNFEKLPKEFKKDWLKALRSGEYRQGQNRLKHIVNGGSTIKRAEYCCLGVACEVVGAKNIEDKCFIENKGGSKIKGITKIPKILKGDDGNIVVGKLAEMNDDGKSFKQIANWIDKHL